MILEFTWIEPGDILSVNLFDALQALESKLASCRSIVVDEEKTMNNW